MRTPDNYESTELKILCEEAGKLEWINRALDHQIRINKNRLAEIDKKLAEEMEKESGK